MTNWVEWIRHCAAHKQWEKFSFSPHHGVNLPLSALRTEKSCGIGEFKDLLPLIDWCAELNLQIIQLLPLNDSGNDPSPYNNLSSCALNPIYISLRALPAIDEDLFKELNLFEKLENRGRIAYAEVHSHKMAWLRRYFEAVAPELSRNPKFHDFIASNPWLKPYALFKVLKNQMEHNSWLTWPRNLVGLHMAEMEELIEKHWNEVCFFIALQYWCCRQLSEVKEYAQEKGIYLKGDIPILISPDSHDVWQHPEFFNLSLAAGAPPDVYNPKGQYWGFPLYNWDVKKRSQYSWWKERITYAAHFYDLFRIDHVVGFFRVWGIPLSQTPDQGSFVPQDENLWIPEGHERIEMILRYSPMLPIAEDLGSVPMEIKQLLMNMGICGTRVMRWERFWDGDKSYVPIGQYPVLSMTTVSTHDSLTLEQWWKELPEEAELYAQSKNWEYSPELSREKRMTILWDSHHSSSLFHINLLLEYLALFPELSWPHPEEERINVPGTISPKNWTYRFRTSLEEIVSHDGLKKAMQAIVFQPASP